MGPLPSSGSESFPQRSRVALIGNPNSGKTTLFNALTGSRYKVANYPGVTVEKKVGKLLSREDQSISVIDLPGIYSLFGSAIDETIASQAVLGSIAGDVAPDLLVVVVDPLNLERNLFLVSQLLDSRVPIIVALNMADVAEKRGVRIYKELLGRQLGVPIVSISAKYGQGIEELAILITQILKSPSATQARRWIDSSNPYFESAQKVGQLAVDLGEVEAAEPFLLGCAFLSETLAPRHESVRHAIREESELLSQNAIDPKTFEATARYRWIHTVVQRCAVLIPKDRVGFYETVDGLLTHRIWGSIILFLVLATIFQAIFLWAEYPMSLIEGIFNFAGKQISAHLEDGILRSLLVDGIIAGVGSVVIFIPQIAILVFLLGLLEDSGYLSRAAYVMDRIMRPFGLQGRSFIPLLSSFACAIPGILACRTIPSWADRLATIMVAPLMSCSARLPVYTVLIAAFIPAHTVLGVLSLQGLTLFGMYVLGILGAALGSWILKKTLLRREPALFVLELPQFRRPSFRVVLRDVFDRIVTFLKNAGTMILACSIVLWFLASFPKVSENPKENIEYTYAAEIGKFIEPVIRPLGFNWEVGVGIVASFAAREVFVSALSTVYHLQDETDDSTSLIETLRKRRENGSFSTASALSLMVFYVFACQCISTLAVCRRETGSWTWPALMFLSMTLLAYLASLACYNIATALGG